MVKLSESAVYIRTKSSIENVKKLNLWGCGIDDISVCDKMHLLEILSLSVNDVKSLAPLKNCKNLKELYLRKNKIEYLDELEHLKDLPNLRVLWVDENPCVEHYSGAEYRRKVVKMLPQVTKLDDKDVTSADHLEADESLPECAMHTSLYSPRSHRSNSTSTNNDMMCRSMYVASTSTNPAVFDRIMQPQMLHFGDTSDEEKPNNFSLDVPGVPILTEETTTVYLDDVGSGRSRPPVNLMSQSMYGTLLEEPSSNEGDDDWNDFSFEEERPMPLSSNRMFQSMHEGMGQYRRPPIGYGRSISMPRRRTTSRNSSTSPARDHRLSKIMSAVSVLMDELDAEGLRQVVDEAQRRIKKQR